MFWRLKSAYLMGKKFPLVEMKYIPRPTNVRTFIQIGQPEVDGKLKVGPDFST